MIDWLADLLIWLNDWLLNWLADKLMCFGLKFDHSVRFLTWHLWLPNTGTQTDYQKVTFKNPTSSCNWGKLSPTVLQLTLPVAVRHDPTQPDMLRMAAKDMIFSFSSDGISASLVAFSGSGSRSTGKISATSDGDSCCVSLKTSSSIVSTWLLLEAAMRKGTTAQQIPQSIRGQQLELLSVFTSTINWK